VSGAAAWRARFEEAAAAWVHIGRIDILEETPSTMDAVRQFGLEPGRLAVALRQTAGRGRGGRRWLDDGEGVALTLVTPLMPPAPPDREGGRLAIAAAVAGAWCLERWLGSGKVGIKWPNDLLVEGRKIGGVLIEATGGFGLVGIGLNAMHRRFPPPLAEIATSLRRELGEGAAIDRLEVAIELVASLDRAIGETLTDLAGHWRRRDALRGRMATVRCGEEIVAGRILEIDPREWIELVPRDGGSPRRLPAAHCEVLDFDREAIR
jgi:BirA family biotin operon repressor/biotin-[acetyl-CoA-carboxylase] ligase